MSIIVSGIKTTIGKLVGYKSQEQVLSKENFLKELKEIVEEKKKPDYYDVVMAEIGNLDPFDTKPRIMDKPMHLVWKYERKNNEVVNWLGEIALNNKEKNRYRREAVSCLEYTNDPRAIDYLIECLKDEDVFHGALMAIGKKLIGTNIATGTYKKPLTEEEEKLIEDILKQANFKGRLEKQPNDPVIDRLNSIEKAYKAYIDSLYSLIQGHEENRTSETIKTQINNRDDELRKSRRELMLSLSQEIGEPKAKLRLIKIALDGYYIDAQRQAFYTLKENDGLEDLINYIKIFFRDVKRLKPVC